MYTVLLCYCLHYKLFACLSTCFLKRCDTDNNVTNLHEWIYHFIIIILSLKRRRKNPYLPKTFSIMRAFFYFFWLIEIVVVMPMHNFTRWMALKEDHKKISVSQTNCLTAFCWCCCYWLFLNFSLSLITLLGVFLILRVSCCNNPFFYQD